MDYEKKYNEALEKAKNALRTDLHESGVWAIKRIFPELAESEDERIRKFLIEILSHGSWRKEWPFGPSEVVAWLEKQKEQKEIPLMNDDADLYFDEWNQQNQNPTKRQCFEEGMKYAQRLQKKQKPVEWSEEDENRLNAVMELLENTSAIHPNYSRRKLIIWLKSLRGKFKED